MSALPTCSNKPRTWCLSISSAVAGEYISYIDCEEDIMWRDRSWHLHPKSILNKMSKWEKLTSSLLFFSQISYRNINWSCRNFEVKENKARSVGWRGRRGEGWRWGEVGWVLLLLLEFFIMSIPIGSHNLVSISVHNFQIKGPRIADWKFKMAVNNPFGSSL